VLSATCAQIGEVAPYSAQILRFVKPILRPTGFSPRARHFNHRSRHFVRALPVELRMLLARRRNERTAVSHASSSFCAVVRISDVIKFVAPG
jgi:hypothetical protein